MIRMDDTRAEEIIGKLLRTGVLISAFVVFAGGILYLRQEGHAARDFQTFHGVSRPLRTMAGVARGAIALDPQSIIQLGLLLLIATPIARVGFAVAAFALERDWLYVGLTLLVLGVLLFSLAQST